jgi:hypothetical protein
MPHFKRKRPKHQRAGCLLCKPHKDERFAKTPRPGSGVDRRLRAVVLDQAIAEGDEFPCKECELNPALNCYSCTAAYAGFMDIDDQAYSDELLSELTHEEYERARFVRARAA